MEDYRELFEVSNVCDGTITIDWACNYPNEVEDLLSRMEDVIEKQKNAKAIIYTDRYNQYLIMPEGVVNAFLYYGIAFGAVQNRLAYLPKKFKTFIIHVDKVTGKDLDDLNELPERVSIVLMAHYEPSAMILNRFDEMKKRFQFNYVQLTR